VSFSTSVGNQTLGGGGVFDFATQQGTLTSTLPGLGWQQMIQDGTATYVKLSDGAAGKPWIKSDAAATLQKLAGISPASATEGDPTSALEFLRGVGADLHKVGSARVRGTPTTHYHGTADLQVAADKAANPGRKAVVQLVAKQFGVTAVPIDVWIDKADRMRQLRTTLDASKFSVPAGIGLTGTVSSTIELYDFGVAFTMPALPPPDQIAEVNPGQASPGGPAAVGGLANPAASPTGAGGNGPAGGTQAPAATGSTTPQSSGGGPSTPGPSGSPGGVVIGQPGPPSPIVIGSVGTYSGLIGASAAPMSQAVQAWVRYTNSKGGLLGHPVDLVVADDHGSGDQHVDALKDLVVNHHVVAFVENAAPMTIARGDQYLRTVGVPVIGTTCSNAVDFASSVIFPPCPTLDDQSYGAISNGVAHHGSKLAFLYCSELPSCSDSRAAVVDHGMAAKAGATVTCQKQFSFVDPSLSCSGGSPDPDLLLMAGIPSAFSRVGKSCCITYVETSASVQYSSKDDVGGNTLLLASATFPFIGSTNPAEAEFQQVMKPSSYGQIPGPAESIGWTAAKEFEVAAIRAAQTSKSISPKTIISALQGFNNETLGGLSVPLNFAGGHAAPGPCWFSLQASGGNWSVLNGGQAQCR
jgi:branched-chain amino acid transport system substrate-binding protein